MLAKRQDNPREAEVRCVVCDARGWPAWVVHLCFISLFLLLSPLYYSNRWHFRRQCRGNPFFTSVLVRLQARYPALYDAGTTIMNFPMGSGVYDLLPPLSGATLQVGCGTGLLNRRLRHRRDIQFTDLDVNDRALAYGKTKGRLNHAVHGRIDRRTPFADRSFDQVVFARSFHHVRNHRLALAECARLLREGGTVVIVDPVMLTEAPAGKGLPGYRVNSSIDGVIWRFTAGSLLEHLRRQSPETLALESFRCQRQRHVSNYNAFVAQTDVVAVLRKVAP
jgi:SAM-dependent methyltransferase